MFFYLKIDNNDKINVLRRLRCVNNGVKLFRYVENDEILMRMGAFVASFIFGMLAMSHASASTELLFDTSVRVGTPLFGRLKLDETAGSSQDFLRLPTRQEVTLFGGEWSDINDTLELVPSVSKAGVFYLSSRLPVKRAQLTIYLVKDQFSELELFAIDLSVSQAGTRVAVRSQVKDKALIKDNGSSIARGSMGANTNNADSQSREPDVGRDNEKTTLSAPTLESPALGATVELDDDLSEKLRLLMAQQAANYVSDRPTAREVMPVNEYLKDGVNDGSASHDAAQSVPAQSNLEKSDMAKSNLAESTVSQVSNGGLNKTSVSTPLESGLNPNGLSVDRSASGPMDASLGASSGWFITATDALIIIAVLWMLYFGRAIFNLQTKISKDSATNLTNLTNTNERENVAERNASLRPSDRSNHHRNTSALAEVLRTAAEQAEKSEALGMQGRLDAYYANLASAQQKVLFDCASQLQGLATPGNNEPSSLGSSAFGAVNQYEASSSSPASATTRAPDDTPTTNPPNIAVDTPRTSPQQSYPGDKESAARRDKPIPLRPKRPAVGRPRIGDAQDDNPSAVSTPRPPVAQSSDYSEQISLAVVYFNMGELETARSLLDDVIKDGSPEEIAQAKKFLEEKYDE